MAHPGGGASLGALAAEPRPDRVVLAIGPEGGWNAFELELLARHGFETIALGPRTLRTDTACIALLALVHEVVLREQG